MHKWLIKVSKSNVMQHCIFHLGHFGIIVYKHAIVMFELITFLCNCGLYNVTFLI